MTSPPTLSGAGSAETVFGRKGFDDDWDDLPEMK